jgi:L-cysteine S-thiosulfotransferase
MVMMALTFAGAHRVGAADAPDMAPVQMAPVQMAPVQVKGDAIPRPLLDNPGDPTRGREIAFSRERGNCIVCHAIGTAGDTLHGNLGPSLHGIADRLSMGQIRLRLVDGRRINPKGIMPSYYRVDGLQRVALAYAGKPVLTAQEIEDVIAFLATLREDRKR